MSDFGTRTSKNRSAKLTKQLKQRHKTNKKANPEIFAQIKNTLNGFIKASKTQKMTISRFLFTKPFERGRENCLICFRCSVYLYLIEPVR